MDALESDSAVAVVAWVRACVKPSPIGFGWYEDGPQPVRHDSSEAAENRSVCSSVGSARAGLTSQRLSVAGVIPSNLSPPAICDCPPRVPSASLLRRPTIRLFHSGGKGVFCADHSQTDPFCHKTTLSADPLQSYSQFQDR